MAGLLLTVAQTALQSLMRVILWSWLVVAGAVITQPAIADSAYLQEFNRAASRIMGTSKDQAEVVLERYGRPDFVDTTAYNQPRPAIVMQWFDYKRATIRVLFIHSGLGDPPPYTTWFLIGFTDIALDEAIPFEEGDRRLIAARH